MALNPLLVGEANPYGDEPRHALFPYPEHSAGGRLCRLVLQLETGAYMRLFDRANLCPTSKWSVRTARATAQAIEALRWTEPRPLVLLGRKVVAAFEPWGGQAPAPFTVYHGVRDYYVLPHPSGLCREWNVPGAFERARALLAPLLGAAP